MNAEAFRRSVAEFDRRVAAIGDDQWSAATPCEAWDVRALVNHVVAEDLWAPPLLAGQTLEEVGDRFDGDVLGDDPKAAWSDASEAAVAAVDAAPAERPVHTSMGEITAAQYVPQIHVDHLIHAWDLARAVGADETLPADLVAAALVMLEPMEPMLRASGSFGDRVEVADEAGAQERLLALCGRAM